MAGTGTSTSDNTNNTSVYDPIYQAALTSGEILNCWVPSQSKLSRGKKGTIQRIYSGDPLNNKCNVYIYNEQTKDWKLEHEIHGALARSGSFFRPNTYLTSNSTLLNGITFTTSSSFDNSNAYKAFANDTSQNNYHTTSGGSARYPHYRPSRWTMYNPGVSWRAGMYDNRFGPSDIGGVQGEWVKIQFSIPVLVDAFKFIETNTIMTSVADSNGNYHALKQVHEFTLMASNNGTSWTNIGNFVNTITVPTDDIVGNITTTTAYTYYGFVITKRNVPSNYSYASGDYVYHHIDIHALSLRVVGPSEDFGRSLDGTDNADMVAIGAPGTWFGSVSNIDGYAYVFTKDSTGNGWTQRGTEVSQQGGFGHSIALSQYDGNILAVGAPFYNTVQPPDHPGGVTFTRNNNWSSGIEPLYVSEGKVYIYKWDGSNYTLQQTLNSPSGSLSSSVTPDNWKNFYFGYSLGITDVGDKIIVGEPSIRNIWSIKDQDVVSTYPSAQDWWAYTGNAHVYDNFTVLDGGTNWTSNVSMTTVIGATGFDYGNNVNHDTDPTKVRWLDALGASVDINRAGTRILAGAPGSVGTLPTVESEGTLEFAGRIYTLDWDPVEGVWKEMGDENSKHINPTQSYIFKGFSTRFDGSGRRIVAGCRAVEGKGIVSVFDWNGDQWVSFPNEMVEISGWNVNSTQPLDQIFALGESVSIDGEGEMIAIGISNLHNSSITPPTGGIRPNLFSVTDMKYIGGATTTVASSDTHIDTGSSNTWVYNIQQSMIVRGNVTVGGFIQGTGMSIGTNDASDRGTKSLFFGGTKGDNTYDLTVIENRLYENNELSELLVFKGGEGQKPDNWRDNWDGIWRGPDKIRLKSSLIGFDLNTDTLDRTEDKTSIVMFEEEGIAKIGVNTKTPSECIDVVGMIKSRDGFSGPGTSLTGIGIDYVNTLLSERLGEAGAIGDSTTWGDSTIATTTMTYPLQTMKLSNGQFNTGYSYEYFTNVTGDSEGPGAAPDDYYYVFEPETIAWPGKLPPDDFDDGWQYGKRTTYHVWDGIEPFESQEWGTRKQWVIDDDRDDNNHLVPGYDGAWISWTIPERIFVEKIEVWCVDHYHIPKVYTIFGSPDQGETWHPLYTNIYGQRPNWWTTADQSWCEIWENDQLDTSKDLAYRTYALVIQSNLGGTQQNLMFDGYPTNHSSRGLMIHRIRVRGKEITYTPKVKITDTGKIGILNLSPTYPLDVDGDINLTGDLRINGVAQTFGGGGGGSGTSVWGQNSTTNQIYYLSGNVGINNSNPQHMLDVTGDINLTGDLKVNGVNRELPVVNSLFTLGSDPNYPNHIYRYYGYVGIGENTSPTAPLHVYISPVYTMGQQIGGQTPETNGIFIENEENGVFNQDGDGNVTVDPVANAILCLKTKFFHGHPYISWKSTWYGYAFGIDGTDGKLKLSAKYDDLNTRTVITITDEGAIYNEEARNNFTQYVGIKNTNPEYDLDVDGDINLTGNLRVNGVVQTIGFIGTVDDFILHTDDPDTKFGFPSTDTFAIHTGNATRLTVSPNGYVGINTIHPLHHLDVNGNINYTGDLLQNGTAQSIWLKNANNPNLIYNNNKVGIKNTNPVYELDVDGDINLTGDIRINGIVQSFNSAGTGSGSSSIWGKNPSNNEIYYNGANVGINTSNPNYTLDVNGDINIQGDIKIHGITQNLSAGGGSSFNGLIQDYIYHDGDYTTKFGFPAPSEFAIDCFGTRVVQIKWGKFGINTIYPGYDLDVVGDINLTGDLRVNGQAQIFGDDVIQPWEIGLGGSAINPGTYNVTIGSDTNHWKANLYIGDWEYWNLTSYLGIQGNDHPSWNITELVSILTEGGIAALRFYEYSDERIKKNIRDIVDSSALEKLRLIEPKIYNYIDEDNNYPGEVYGFIAQQVSNVLPNAVTIGERHIPNILTNSKVNVIENSNVVELTLDTTPEGLSLSNTSSILITTDKDKSLSCQVISQTGNIITIDDPNNSFSNISNAFIQGEYIKDFHTLNKNAIFTVATAALQEVDRQLQAEKTKVATLETQVENLLARVTALENA